MTTALGILLAFVVGFIAGMVAKWYMDRRKITV